MDAAGAGPDREVVILSKEECLQKAVDSWIKEGVPLAHFRDQYSTMLEYWKGQPDSMLRRVALRCGAFMLSQCETERVNKIAKQVWVPSRAKLHARSMMREVFLHYNMKLFPSWRELDFYYKKGC